MQVLELDLEDEGKLRFSYTSEDIGVSLSTPDSLTVESISHRQAKELRDFLNNLEL